MAWMAGSSPAMTVVVEQCAAGGATRCWRQFSCSLFSQESPGAYPPSVITGLEPVIHAMTMQKHCPQTRFSL
jgi:hypothetical protein